MKSTWLRCVSRAVLVAALAAPVSSTSPAWGQAPQAYQIAGGPPFVFENSSRPQASIEDGTLELTEGEGWLRTPAVLADFRLALEYRLQVKGGNAGVVVRSWIGREEWPRAGYRIRLGTSDAKNGTNLLEAWRRPIALLSAPAPMWRAPGEWQRLEVVARAERVEVAVNGQPAGAFEIDERAGYLMLDARKGAVEFRGVTLEVLPRGGERPANALSLEALQQGGGTLPQVIRNVQPLYTPGASDTALRVQGGQAVLEAVVLPNGKASGIRVTRSLFPAFDEAAVVALERWRFRPATIKGEAVPVIVSVEMAFSHQ